MPLKKGKSRKTVSENIRTEMHEYEKSGKIGRSKPASKKKAQKQAVAIALNTARRSGATEAEISKGGSAPKKRVKKSTRKTAASRKTAAKKTTKSSTSWKKATRKTSRKTTRKSATTRKKSAMKKTGRTKRVTRRSKGK